MNEYRYDRAPSPSIIAELGKSAELMALLRTRSVAGLRLDVHFREDDHVHLYCGLTRLLDVAFRGQKLVASAHPTYALQPCAAALMRTWVQPFAGFAAALDTYFTAVVVDPMLVQREGAVQEAWSGVTSPWTAFDREAVIGYPSRNARTEARTFPSVNAAQTGLLRIAAEERWAAPPVAKVGAELDQLAIDDAGRLVLLELKDAAASPASVFYAPLQVLQYAHEWAAALPGLLPNLQRQIDARVALGLMVDRKVRLTGELRVAVGFGSDRRSAEVRRRYERVVEEVRPFLPAGVQEIETWALVDKGPVRL